MLIEIDTATASALELNALAALINVLAGRMPATTIRTTVNVAPDAEIPNAPTTFTSASGTAAPLGSTAPTQDADDDDAAAIAGAPDRDSAGLPWDERIHASSRATIADGTWRRRKNTPDATYDAVMAELRAAVPNGTASAADAPPAPPIDDTPLPPTSTEPADTGSAAVAATTAAEDVPPPPASDGPDLSTFPKFVQAVNGKDVPPERKTYQALNELCESFGVAAFKDMKDKPGDWQMFYDMVG